MQRVKDFFSKFWIFLLGVIGILLYTLNLKDNELDELKVESELAKTKEDVIRVETKIQNKILERNLNNLKLKQAQDVLDSIEKKKNEIVESENLTDKEKEDYWK